MGKAGGRTFTGIFNRIAIVPGISNLGLSFARFPTSSSNATERSATVGAADVRYGGRLDFSLKLGADVLKVESTAAGCCVPRAEVQTITCIATGGTYTVSAGYNSTDINAISMTSFEIEKRLESLEGITDVSIFMNGGDPCNVTGGVIIVSFAIIAPHAGDFPLLLVNGTTLTNSGSGSGGSGGSGSSSDQSTSVTITETVAGSLGASTSLPGEYIEVLDDVMTSCVGTEHAENGTTTLSCSVAKVSTPLFVALADNRSLMLSQYVHVCNGNFSICQRSTGNVIGDRIIEIYNPHCGNAIDLSVYSLSIQQKYGISWSQALSEAAAAASSGSSSSSTGTTTRIELSGTMLGKQTYTLCNAGASVATKSKCDLIVSDDIMNFDGTLPVALVKDINLNGIGVVVDAIGDVSNTVCRGTLIGTLCRFDDELTYRAMFIPVSRIMISFSFFSLFFFFFAQ